jgi:hypothetical protein
MAFYLFNFDTGRADEERPLRMLERLAGAVVTLNGVAVIVRGVWFSHGAIVGL